VGLYDDLTCKMPLPEPRPPEGTTFQTKDLGQSMERFTITADGLLIHHTVRYEDVPREERPYPDAEPGDWRSICGIIRSIPTGDVEVPYHGDVRFYRCASRTYEWWEYIARFTEGRCVRITLSEYTPPRVSDEQAKPEDPKGLSPKGASAAREAGDAQP
jgi:hypothetical protein